MTDKGNIKSYQYPLEYLYFYLTEGCNLACKHCWLKPKHQNGDKLYPSMDFGLMKSIIEEAKPLGLTEVKLTGGEPLMHPDIIKILDYLKNFDLCLGVETNAVLCTPQIAVKIASCKSPQVSVSLDAAGAEIHNLIRGVPDCFAAAVEGIRHLTDVGIHPQIIMSLMNCNKNEIEPLVSLSESLGASSVKINIIQPTGRGKKMQEKGETPGIEEILELSQWVSDTLTPSTQMKIYFDIPAAFTPLNKMFSPEEDGCGVCGIMKVMGVLANGDYALCGIGSQVPELVFGHGAIDSLADIWQCHPVLKELRGGIPHRFEGICGACLMKKVCGGKCIAQNFYRRKSLWAPFWFCESALDKGIFPESRLRPNYKETIDLYRANTAKYETVGTTAVSSSQKT